LSKPLALVPWFACAINIGVTGFALAGGGAIVGSDIGFKVELDQGFATNAPDELMVDALIGAIGV